MFFSISSISNRSSLCLLNLSCAQNILDMCILLIQANSSPGVGIMGTPLTIARELLSQVRQCQAGACENSIFCRYSLQLLHLYFLPFKLETTWRSNGGFVEGFGRGECRYFRRDCMASEHALGSFSFLSTSDFKWYHPIPSTLLTITTSRQERAAHHDCEGQPGIVGSQSPLALAEWAER